MTIQKTKTQGQISIKIDGTDVASFSELQGITTQVDRPAAPRRIMAHQLSHTVQQAARARRFAMNVKAAQLGHVAAQRLARAKGRKMILHVTDDAGRPAAAFRATFHSATQSKAQEWTLVYEGIQRVDV